METEESGKHSKQGNQMAVVCTTNNRGKMNETAISMETQQGKEMSTEDKYNESYKGQGFNTGDTQDRCQ